MVSGAVIPVLLTAWLSLPVSNGGYFYLTCYHCPSVTDVAGSEVNYIHSMNMDENEFCNVLSRLTPRKRLWNSPKICHEYLNYQNTPRIFCKVFTKTLHPGPPEIVRKIQKACVPYQKWDHDNCWVNGSKKQDDCEVCETDLCNTGLNSRSYKFHDPDFFKGPNYDDDRLVWVDTEVLGYLWRRLKSAVHNSARHILDLFKTE